MKYTVQDLRVDFPDEEACLQWLVDWLYPDGIPCKTCNTVTKHHKLKHRKVYSCQYCGTQVSPTAGTIYHKSRTPLQLWFYATYLISTNKAGTSAAQLQRELGVTYKTAFRMMHQIRKMMIPPERQLEGEVEIDETYVHANTFKRSSARKRYGRTGQRAGQVLFGLVERGGPVKIFHIKAPGERVLTPLIRQHVKRGTLIHSDGYMAYKKLPLWGYGHRTTNHGIGEYYREDSYTQNIENVWSHFKRGIKGVYRHVSPQYLQAYADEFGWRYSNRNKPSVFWSLMCRIGKN